MQPLIDMIGFNNTVWLGLCSLIAVPTFYIIVKTRKIQNQNLSDA